VEKQWDQVITMIREKFPAAANLMEQAKKDVLAFRSFPPEQWHKIGSTNPLERLNKEIKRSTRVVGIVPQRCRDRPTGGCTAARAAGGVAA
jgi:putative transposase